VAAVAHVLVEFDEGSWIEHGGDALDLFSDCAPVQEALTPEFCGIYEAVKRNDKIQLVLDPTTGSGGWSVQQTDGTELQGSHFAEGAANLAFVTSPATLTKVTFNGLGMVDAKNADTTLPFDTVDVSSSVTGTHPLRILVGGARTGIKICNTDYTWPDPKACPP